MTIPPKTYRCVAPIFKGSLFQNMIINPKPKKQKNAINPKISKNRSLGGFCLKLSNSGIQKTIDRYRKA